MEITDIFIFRKKLLKFLQGDTVFLDNANQFPFPFLAKCANNIYSHRSHSLCFFQISRSWHYWHSYENKLEILDNQMNLSTNLFQDLIVTGKVTVNYF